MIVWPSRPRSRTFEYPEVSLLTASSHILLPPQQRLTVLNFVNLFLLFPYGFYHLSLYSLKYAENNALFTFVWFRDSSLLMYRPIYFLHFYLFIHSIVDGHFSFLPAYCPYDQCCCKHSYLVHQCKIFLEYIPHSRLQVKGYMDIQPNQIPSLCLEWLYQFI